MNIFSVPGFIYDKYAIVGLRFVIIAQIFFLWQKIGKNIPMRRVRFWRTIFFSKEHFVFAYCNVVDDKMMIFLTRRTFLIVKNVLVWIF